MVMVATDGLIHYDLMHHTSHYDYYNTSLSSAPPTHSPIIQGFKSSGYALYEEVNVTCISPAAHPLPTISWFINDQLAPESYVRYSMKNDTQLIVTLNFRVDVHHLMFGQPKMRLKCRAALSFNSSLEYG